MKIKKISNTAPLPALLGGKPVQKKPLQPVYNIGPREIHAAQAVLKSGSLSGFVGVAGDKFLGGPAVKRFESACSKKFKVAHAVSFNSATTALHGAVVALGIGPGDEVIVPPYTMSATVTAVLMNGAVPIFADIDERTFCIDPKSVELVITPRTKAIIVVNLFGQPADFKALLRIAKAHKIAIIEDNAQGPGAQWREKFAGTIGDLGVFSFNVHKTIQAGEGGVLVTNNAQYALRAQMSRNHGESVVPGLPDYKAGPIFGSNYRMTEINAAIAEVQLARMDQFNRSRIALVRRMEKGLQNIPGLTLSYISPENKSVYYVYPFTIEENAFGMSRDVFVEAMKAEGFPMSRGYVKPLYLLPLFQQKQAFNNTHFPFDYDGMNPDYKKGICPVVERMHDKELVTTDICQYPRTNDNIDMFIQAVKKIVAHKKEINEHSV